MEAYSPSKRRALAPLDANAKGTPKHHKLERPSTVMGTPLRLFADGRKRGLEEENSVGMSGKKKACVAREEIPRSRSQSPDESSVFDTSANDASWATAASEVDVERVPARTRALTRDEAREKAEILRLRLTLANYKLRTNQIHLPLADLQRKPLPRRVVRVQSPHSSPERIRQPQPPQQGQDPEHGYPHDVHPDIRQPVSVHESSGGEAVVHVHQMQMMAMGMTIPRLGMGERTATPVSGGAATGLLSLSQGELSS